VFEDHVVAFKEEDTPVEFSRATSLSSLTIDDEPKISNDAMLKVCLSVCLNEYLSVHLCVCMPVYTVHSFIYLSSSTSSSSSSLSPLHPHHHHKSRKDFVASPPRCGRSVNHMGGWDTHEARLCCPDEVDGDIWIWSAGRGLKPKFY
jgi:hypothetical protein